MTNNALAFTALCNEYCAAVEDCFSTGRSRFVDTILRLLPRIYICANDRLTDMSTPEIDIDAYLDEATYNIVRQRIAQLMADEDTYLEVFLDDMKYSDTPIAATVSENLADLFQVFYNFLETIRDAPDNLVEASLAAIQTDFVDYWSQILCNVLRALNSIHINLADDDATL